MIKSKKIREIVAMVQKDIEKSLQDIQEGKCISADEYEKGIAIETVKQFAKSADGKIDSEKIALASQKLAKLGYTAEEVAKIGKVRWKIETILQRDNRGNIYVICTACGAENEVDMHAEKIQLPSKCKTCGREIDMDAVRKIYEEDLKRW